MLFILKNLKNINIVIKSFSNNNNNRNNFNPLYNNLKYLYTRTFIHLNKNKQNFLRSSFIRSNAKSSIKNGNIKKIKKTEIRRLLSMAKPEKNKLASICLIKIKKKKFKLIF